MSYYPLIEDLPKNEQVPFRRWLAGQTRPVLIDGRVGYYEHDYKNWKESLENEIG